MNFGGGFESVRISTRVAGIHLAHEEQDLQRKIAYPLPGLWGEKGFIHRTYDVLDVWREWAVQVEGRGLDCGHFLPEETPEAVTGELLRFSG